MKSPLVSVVIPAYNQAQFLSEAIQSVLAQSYQNFEIIVVNDASSDGTTQVVAEINDPRLKYIVHPENRGLPAARNTGMHASKGELIALLDSDDIFHPNKIQVHVDFLQERPEIGVSYNSRFNLNHSATTIRDLWRPPLMVDLNDFLLGFPFAPSDMVIRQEWAFEVDLFDESYTSGGEDLDFPCRLALAGCKFASVDRALNYRRYHASRRKRSLVNRLNDYKNALNTVFNASSCPSDALALRNAAFANYHLEVAYLALAQQESDLGQTTLRRVIQLNPSILNGKPCPLMKSFLANSIADENKNHETILHDILAQLPSEISWLNGQYDWAVGKGYLLKGARALLWERSDDGRAYFEQAASLDAKIDEPFLRHLATQLTNYEAEFGPASAENIVRELGYQFDKMGDKNSARWLCGLYYFHRAFQSYWDGEYRRVPKSIWEAVIQNPSYLTNRGVLSILLRSTTSLLTDRISETV